MSRPAGEARAALLDALASGARGTYDALAELAGVKPETARATLKELSRCGVACARDGNGNPAARGCPAPAVYTAYQHQQPFDALGFARQVWR